MYVATNIINAAIPLLILPILTRFLSPADYGIVSIYQIIQSIFVILIGLNTHGAVTTNFFRISKEELKVYIGNILIILVSSFVVIFGILMLVKSSLAERIGFPENWLPVILIAAFFQFLITINLIIWQSEQRPKPYSIVQVISTVINLSLSILFIVVIKMEWEGRILAAVITTILFGVISFYILYTRGYIKFSFNRSHITDALKFGIPLIPHSLAGFIITASDRILITTMVGISATGLYTVGYQIALVIELLATSFNTAWVPFLFKKLTENDYDSKLKIVKFTYAYFFAILIFALLLAFLSPYFLSIFVGEQYQSSYKFVIWIALAYAFSGMYYMVTNYIFYMKKTYLLTWVTFGSALLNIGLNYVLIKLNGAIGAAQATAISYVITFIAVWILSAKVYKMPWRLTRQPAMTSP